MTRYGLLRFLCVLIIKLHAEDEKAIFESLRSGQPWATTSANSESEQWRRSVSSLFELKYSLRGSDRIGLVARMIPVLLDFLNRPEVSPLVIVNVINLFDKQDASTPIACDFVVECLDRLSRHECEDHLLSGHLSGTIVTDASAIESSLRVIVSMGIQNNRILPIADTLGAQNRLDSTALQMLIRAFPGASCMAIDHAMESIAMKNPSLWSPDDFYIMHNGWRVR
jgi:hypothetical protein